MFKKMFGAIVSQVEMRRASKKISSRTENALQKRFRWGMQVVELESRINPVTVINFADQDTNGTVAGSLRAAIEAINSTSTPPVISFDPGIFDVSAFPIQLTSSLPQLKYDTTITGFADSTRVRINAAFQGNHFDVFTSDYANGNVDLAVSGLRIIGSAEGISVGKGDLSVSNVVIQDLPSTAIAVSVGLGDLVLQDSLIENLFYGVSVGQGNAALNNTIFRNIANNGAGAAVNIGYGDAFVENSRFENCSAGVAGGAISVGFGDITILGDGNPATPEFLNCTAGTFGGAIYSHTGQISVSDAEFSGCQVTALPSGSPQFPDFVAGGAIYSGLGDAALSHVDMDGCKVMVVSLPGDGMGVRLAF